MSTTVNEVRHVKRRRRTKAELKAIDDHIIDILENEHPASLRNVYYRLVTRGVVPKDDSGYQVAQRQLLKLRRSGAVPYSWVADGTRVRRRARTYSSLEAALEETAATYRRALWDRTSERVEVWCESDSLAGVIHPVTHAYDVDLLAARGFSSDTFLYESADEYRCDGRPVVIYYFGDWDPSGAAIGDTVNRKLREFVPEVPITFVRVTVTLEQITDWQLPWLPPKKTDTRTKRFVEKYGPVTCEAEAVQPTEMRRMCEECIASHLDPDEVELLEMVENEERDLLQRMANHSFIDVLKRSTATGSQDP